MEQIVLILAIGIFAVAVRQTGILGGLILSFGLSFLVTYVVWSTVQTILLWPIYLPLAIALILVGGYTIGHWYGRNWRR